MLLQKIRFVAPGWANTFFGRWAGGLFPASERPATGHWAGSLFETGDAHGGGSGSGRSEGSGVSSGGDCESRSEGSGGNIGGTSSSDSSRAAGNKAKKKSKVGAGVGVTESRLDRRLERAGGNRVGPGRNGSTSGG